MNTFCQDQEDENYKNNGNCRMKDNILNLPRDVLGDIFKE